MKTLTIISFVFTATILNFSCSTPKTTDDVLLDSFSPSKGFGVFTEEKKAELEKRFASKEQKALEGKGEASLGTAKSSVFNLNSEGTAKPAKTDNVSDGPRAASVLPEKTCTEIFGVIKNYTAEKNKTFIVKNINVGLIFISKTENDPDYVFISPSANFMMSPKASDKMISIKCVENGDYFDLITNLKLFSNN